MFTAIVLALGVATEYGKGSEVTLYANKVCSHVQAQMLHSDSCDFLSRSDHLQTPARSMPSTTSHIVHQPTLRSSVRTLVRCSKVTGLRLSSSSTPNMRIA